MTDEEVPEPAPYEKYVYEIREKWDLDFHRNKDDVEEFDTPDWITDLDREICILLDTGLVLTPSLIAKNLDRPSSSISRRLSTLEAGGIVKKIERGHYALTNEGWARMAQKLTNEHLDSTERPEIPDGFYTAKIPSPEEAKRMEE